MARAVGINLSRTHVVEATSTLKRRSQLRPVVRQCQGRYSAVPKLWQRPSARARRRQGRAIAQHEGSKDHARAGTNRYFGGVFRLIASDLYRPVLPTCRAIQRPQLQNMGDGDKIFRHHCSRASMEEQLRRSILDDSKFINRGSVASGSDEIEVRLRSEGQSHEELSTPTALSANTTKPDCVPGGSHRFE